MSRLGSMFVLTRVDTWVYQFLYFSRFKTRAISVEFSEAVSFLRKGMLKIVPHGPTVSSETNCPPPSQMLTTTLPEWPWRSPSSWRGSDSSQEWAEVPSSHSCRSPESRLLVEDRVSWNGRENHYKHLIFYIFFYYFITDYILSSCWKCNGWKS